MAALPEKLRYAFTPSGGYKEGTLYSLVPNDNVGNFDVTGTGVRTRVNKDGLIEVVDANVPRLDYSDGGCPKLLTEPASKNLIKNSEPTSAEGASGGVTYESFSWANGFTNCVKFTDNLSTRFWYGGSATSGNIYTISVYILMDDGSKPQAGLDNSSGDFSLVISGTQNVGVNGSLKYKKCLGNIWRVSANYNVIGGSSSNNGLVKFSGQSSKGFRVVGFQLEQQPQATSYIPTNGDTEQRGADSVTNAGDSSTFNSESGVLFVDVKAEGSGDRLIGLTSGTTANRIQFIATSGDYIQFNCSGQGVSVFPQDQATDVYLQNKIGGRWQDGKFDIYTNGLLITTNTTFRSPASGFLQQLDFNQVPSGANFQGKTKSVQHYDYLSDLEMEQLTGYDSYSAMTSQFNFNVL